MEPRPRWWKAVIRPEWLVLLVAVGLHTELLHGYYSTPMLLATSSLSQMSLYSWLGWFVASTIVPDPTDGVLTNTQGLLLVTALTVPWRLRKAAGRGPSLRVGRAEALLFIGLAGWLGVSSIANGDTPFGLELGKVALFVGVLFIVLRSGDFDVKRTTQLCLLFGLLAASGYWLRMLGVAEMGQLHEVTAAGVHKFERVASGKADPNALGFLLVPLIAVCALSAARRDRSTGGVAVDALTLFICVPATIATTSRGTLAALVICTTLLGVFMLRGLRLWRFALSATAVVIVLGVTELPGTVSESVEDYRDYVSARGMDGRTEYWSDAAGAIGEAPLTGIGWDQYLERSGMLPHNTYLDLGVVGGLPAIALAVVLWIMPLVKAAKLGYTRLKPGGFEAVALLTATLIVSFSLSAITNKLVWLQWLLVAAAVNQADGPDREARHRLRESM